MFGKLKEKLKNWVSKNKEEEIVETVPTTTNKKSKSVSKPKKISPKKESKKKVAIEEPKAKEEPIITPKKSIFSKFQKTLTQEKFDNLFQELQIILLQNNVAYETVEAIEASLSKPLVGKPMKKVNLATELKTAIESLLINPPNFINQIKSSDSKPYIILFAGINGSGKTTTIAKVAHYLQKNKLSVCLAAADTFRAAAIQQLEEHAQKLNVPLIKKDYGADPAAVGFDAIKYAKKNKIDVVLIDTAGRMQNSDTLMKEIEKIARVTKPDMKIFLGESITGNDATLQAKAFNDSIGLTGIILSKADIDEKGGTALSVSHVTNKPILFLGTGQDYKDLEIFDKEKLIEKLGL
ncbi:signal recognition particle-docking protein FtsY [archaeon]|jgi:fused signal recognition particle receptor|nr:signal recognition particle-docking protein FtsY [archaeon]MBT7129063.1 signal recognition particle-docking protein FtsY [archaeon]